MKLILTIYLTFIYISVNAQEIKFEVQFSENYAVFEFVRHLSEYYPPNAFKEVYDRSMYNTPEYDSLINEFNSLNYYYWYDYKGYPYGSKIGGSTYFILAKNLIENKTLEEFKKESFGIIPNSDLNIFYDVLSKFLPVYEEIIYKPSKSNFETQLHDVQKLIDSSDISLYFNQVIHFHQSIWNNSVTFYTSLYPIPDNRIKGFTATAFYNQAVGGIPLGLRDYELLLSVMFHEAFHILYDEQPKQIKNEVAQWFVENPSESSTYAQLLFNEAITTSLANGYVYKKIKGDILEDAWYNNKYIAQMAETVYPLVEQYIKSKKQLDKEFIDTYIELFDKNHKTWLYEVPHLTMNRYIIADEKEDYNFIRKKFRYNNIEESSSELNEITLKDMTLHPVTKIIVVSKDNRRKLSLIKNSFEELTDWVISANEDFSYTQLLRDRTYLIVINRQKQELEYILKDIKFNE